MDTLASGKSTCVSLLSFKMRVFNLEKWAYIFMNKDGNIPVH